MADLKFYDVIERPVITENSMSVLDEKKYTFIVHPEATKAQIKDAVEKMFEPFESYPFASPDTIAGAVVLKGDLQAV